MFEKMSEKVQKHLPELIAASIGGFVFVLCCAVFYSLSAAS